MTSSCLGPHKGPGIILGMSAANERRRYYVTPSLIGWAHAQNDPCLEIVFWFQTSSDDEEISLLDSLDTHGVSRVSAATDEPVTGLNVSVCCEFTDSLMLEKPTWTLPLRRQVIKRFSNFDIVNMDLIFHTKNCGLCMRPECRHASRHVRDARAVMHAGIAN